MLTKYLQTDYLMTFCICLSPQVEPFAGIASAVDRSTPRLLLNREIVGPFSRRWERRGNDVVQCGDVVEGVHKLVDLLGWSESMDAIMNSANEKWKQKVSIMDANVNKASEELAKSIGKTSEEKASKKLPQNSNGQQKNLANDSSGLNPFGNRNLHSLANGFVGTGVLYRTNKSVVFMSREGPLRPNLATQRAPLLPFRCSQRKDLSSQDKNADFKVIDPGKDLASAGFGLGRRSAGRLGCFLAGTAGESSSDDD